MKVYEAAKLLGRDSKELAAELGLKSTRSAIPDHVLVKLGMETPDNPNPVTVNQARALRRGGGDKTIEFLRFVQDHQTDIPEEYGRVKHLIERFL